MYKLNSIVGSVAPGFVFNYPAAEKVCDIGTCYIAVRCEGRKEMFYLMTHSTHFIIRLYGIRHTVMDNSAREEIRFRHYMGYSF